ncbi:hypothetical protein BHS09_17190 [Myxococcus xanthus]|uniref:Tyr recombinase domain-containing protein n=1 Tax=Myxococcus xanthus TaxID=34 RepID=A0AAE6G0Q6_MYXXA|nr:hypothetical protein BHS09_17190 [Myxococcus xanthus]QDE75857.1 hypothetical protein BHS08_17205 [Myxococcus xanthus]
MSSKQRWPGGYFHKQQDGQPLFIIDRRVRGQRFHVSTRCHNLRLAMKQLERFEADPLGVAVGVPAFTFGVMRHSVTTWSVEQGAAPPLVPEFLNHKDKRTTQRFYTDVSVLTVQVSITRSTRQPGREYSVSIPWVYSPCWPSAASTHSSEGNHTKCGRATEAGDAHHPSPEYEGEFPQGTCATTFHRCLRTSLADWPGLICTQSGRGI